MAAMTPINDVDPSAIVGVNTRIWHHAQVREGARLGDNCIIGRGAYIGPGVRIGDNCKVQNLALVYDPAVLEDGVFIGPAVVLTNDQYPRAVAPDGALRGPDDWEIVGVTVRTGASIGARAVCVAPVSIGAWALVGAGSTVVHDVPDFALVAGAPARRIGWVGRFGVPLVTDDGRTWRCPKTGEMYREQDGLLELSQGAPE
jgi:acetyltransferase-like isoleucine patch superfamily enzyme